MTGAIRVSGCDGPVADRAVYADTFWLKLRGLMGRRRLSRGEALILPRTNAVHTLFMRFPIDLIFCDQAGTVLKVFSGVAPWRIGPVVSHARWVVEMPSGTAEASWVGRTVTWHPRREP